MHGAGNGGRDSLTVDYISTAVHSDEFIRLRHIRLHRHFVILDEEIRDPELVNLSRDQQTAITDIRVGKTSVQPSLSDVHINGEVLREITRNQMKVRKE